MTDNFELGLSSIPLVSPVLLDRSGSPITGSSTIVVEIRRFGTSDRWDFNDNTFKTSGWTTRQGALTEVSASLDPGIYERAAGWVATSVVAGFYIITYRDTASSALPAIEAVRLGGPADTIATNLNTKLAIATGTAQAGAASSLTLAAGASSTDNLYRFLLITITGGTGAGQSRLILAYVGSTKIATVHRAWTTTPDSTSTYAISAASAPGIVTAGPAQAGASSTITLASFSSAIDDTYVGETVWISGGTGFGQERVITAYNGTTKIATVERAWTTTPDSTSTYEVYPFGRVVVGALGTDAIDAASVKADAVTKIQNGLASRAMMVFDTEIGESAFGEAVYFPYFKNGEAVVGATVTMMVSRYGLADPGPGYEFQTLDFSAEIFVPPADNTYHLITMSPVDASAPGVYTAYAYVSGFATNSVKPDVYTVWFYDGTELVGMGRLRAGTTDTIAALPAAITSARDHVETAVAAGFTEIKGVDFDTATDSLRAMRVRGDTAWLTANISGLATSQNVLDAVSTIEGYGDTHWLTATGFATSTNVTDARDHVEAYGAAHWNTATGFAVPGSAMNLADAALLPAKIGAGFVAAMQANLALEATLTAMKGASFDSATDSLRATRVLVSALPTTAAPTADAIVTAVWATEADGAEGTALGKLTLLHDRQTGRRKMGNDGYELIYARDNVTVIKKTLVKDINGDIVIPGAGDPSEVSQEMDP